MPQLYFDLNVFKGRPVNDSFAARRHAFLEYETYNIDKMDLTPGEREVATKQIVHRLNDVAQSWVGDGSAFRLKGGVETHHHP